MSVSDAGSGSGGGPQKEPSLNRSVERACAVMAAFGHGHSELTLAELARQVQLPKATVYRLASSLINSGFMAQLDNGSYALGFKLLELGSVVRDNLDIVGACLPNMRALAAQTHETVLLAQIDWPARELVIVHRIDSQLPVSVLSRTGRRSSIRPGCIGKAALMGLPEEQADLIVQELDLAPLTSNTMIDRDDLRRDIAASRERGYAREEEEFLPGVAGVAAPVLFDGGLPLGAVGIVGPAARLHGRLDALGAVLRQVVGSSPASPVSPR